MKNLKRTTPIALALLVATLFAGAGSARAANLRFEVTVTNLTQGVIFTPFLIASHKPGVKLFTLGQPASTELESVAEEGNTVPLQNLLDADPRVAATATTGAPLPPGQSVTAVVDAKFGFNRISLVGMLLPTNDGFVALNDVQGPFLPGRPDVHFSPGYDAGTEVNDEDCANSIPGPPGLCFGVNAGTDENGVVHIHSGIHGIDGLAEHLYDWRNPVAKIVIRRMY